MKKQYLKNTYITYTITFLLLLPIVFLPFILEGKSLVWHLDGLDQHLPLLQYYGKLLRGLLTGKGFPMVDFKLGLGFDTITTINYYVLGDPLTLLTVFMTPKNAIPFYNFLILLRFYLAGISFIALMKYWKKDGLGTALGALIYVFCGFSLYACIRHPFFSNPMIYLPFMIIGIEQVLRGKKPHLFIFMVFISAVSNFYFFFDLTVIITVYIIFRYFTDYRKSYKNTISGFFITGLKTGGYYLLGVISASVIFLPVIYAFSRNGRLDAGPKPLTGLLHYESKYYLKALQGMFAAGVYPKYWTVLSFSCVTAVSFAILICGRKYRKLVIALILTVFALFVPAFGYFMNGFSYITNRWCFLLSLLVATAFTVTYDRFFDLNKKEKYVLLAEIMLYGVLAFAFPSKSIVKIVFFVLVLIFLLILIFQSKRLKDRKALMEAVIFGLVFLTLGGNGYALYSPRYKNYASQFLSSARIHKLSRKGVLSMFPEIQDKSFYRIDTYGNRALNEALVVGCHDVSGYYSLMDGNVTSYLKGLEDNNQISAYRFQNFDNRAIPDTLANVKYFVTTNPSAAPYGFQLMKQKKNGKQSFYLYQNEFALPLGYTYENYMLEKDYDRLGALQKQNALLNAAVLEQDTDYADKTVKNNNDGIQALNLKVTPGSDILFDKHSIKIKKAGAALNLKFLSMPDTETYIRLENFGIDKKKSVTANFITKGTNGAAKKGNVRSVYYSSYFGKVNQLINTGYSLNGETGAVITFPTTMNYSYNSIKAYSVDMKEYKNQVQALGRHSLQNIKIQNNKVEGDIVLDQKGIMVLGIPYSKGWSANVDGKRTKLLRANVMYSALPLIAGSHHITLSYETPYLRTGLLISLAAIAFWIEIAFFGKAAGKAPLKKTDETAASEEGAVMIEQKMREMKLIKQHMGKRRKKKE